MTGLLKALPASKSTSLGAARGLRRGSCRSPHPAPRRPDLPMAIPSTDSTATISARPTWPGPIACCRSPSRPIRGRRCGSRYRRPSRRRWTGRSSSINRSGWRSIPRSRDRPGNRTRSPSCHPAAVPRSWRWTRRRAISRRTMPPAQPPGGVRVRPVRTFRPRRHAPHNLRGWGHAASVSMTDRGPLTVGVPAPARARRCPRSGSCFSAAATAWRFFGHGWLKRRNGASPALN